MYKGQFENFLGFSIQIPGRKRAENMFYVVELELLLRPIIT